MGLKFDLKGPQQKMVVRGSVCPLFTFTSIKFVLHFLAVVTCSIRF